VLVSFNIRLGSEEVEHILGHSGARMVFVDHELSDVVEGADLPTVRFDDTGAPGETRTKRLRRGGSPEHFELSVLDEEEAISITYTVHLGVVTHPAAQHVKRGLTVTTGGAPPHPLCSRRRRS
jgi:hypothetical protein